MTVQTSTNVASFNGDGANKVFPIGYKFNSAADLVVTLIDDEAKTTQILTLNSDFTVTGAGDEEGGVVTLVVAPTAVQRLKATRVVDILQLTDLRNQGKFYAEIHEDVFDLLIMIDQQQQTEIDDANAKSDEAVATANEANAKSDQAVAKAAQNLIDMQAQYDAFEQGASLVVIGDYAAGLVVDGYNKVFRKDGEFYRAKAELTLPYPLNGDWAVDAPNFVSVGDAVLRQELAGDPVEGLGALIVGGSAICVETVSELRSIDQSGQEQGRTAIVRGSIFEFNGTSWMPRGPVDVRAYGAVGDGVTDDTAAIQQCVNECAQVVIRDGVFLVDGVDPSGPFGRQGVRIPSNRTIDFVDAEVRVIPTDSDGYNAFLVLRDENITLNGPVIVGDRDSHAGTTGEWGMGIEIISGRNVNINDGRISNCWGDGIYIGQIQEADGPCVNINIARTICDGNRRQGMSVISVDGLFVSNSEFNNTNGTAPQAGVDFEPNHSHNVLKNIHFRSVTTRNNASAGLLFWLGNLSADGNEMSMVFDSFEDYGSERAVYFGSTMLASGSGAITFNRPVSRNGKNGSFAVRNWSKLAPRIVFNQPASINATTNPAATSISENSAISCFTLSTFTGEGGVFGNVEIYDPSFVNDGSVAVYAPHNIHFPSTAEGCLLAYTPDPGNPGRTENFGCGLRFDTKNSLIARGTSVWTFWSGTSPVTLSGSPSSYYDRIENDPTKQCFFRLPDLDGSSQGVELKFYFRGGTNNFQVLPPVGKTLVSAGLFDNGAQLAVSERKAGASIRVKLVNGDWSVVGYVGGWSGL